MKMEMNTRMVTVTTSYSESDSLFVAVTDEPCGPVVSGITEEEVAMEMKKALKVYGAMISFVNAINLFEKDELGKDSLKESVIRYEAAA